MTECTPTTDDLFSWLSSITTEEDVRSVRRWLAERDRQVAERAWGEAQQATYAKLRQIWPDYPEPAKNSRVSNPYRKEATGD